MLEKIEAAKIDLVLEKSLAGIPHRHLADSKTLLSEIVGILSSNGFKWSKIELVSRKNGRIVVENRQVSNGLDETHSRLIRIIRVSREDIVCIAVSIEK